MRRLFSLLLAPLVWLGRQNTRALAALVVVGIAVPPLGEALRPWFGPAIFVMLALSFLRADVAALRGHLRQPALVLAATGWTALAVPTICAALCLTAGVDRLAPELFLGLMLQAVASPLMATPAVVALIGLDATLALITMITATALVPITAPLFAYAVFGPALALSPLALGVKLFGYLAGSLTVAAAIRVFIGLDAIQRQKEALDGVSLVVLYVCVAVLMCNVAGDFAAAPVAALTLTLVALAVYAALFGSTALVFRRAGSEAVALGVLTAQRNTALMLAATEGVLPGATWLYFAMCQFPIFFAPHLLKPLARRHVAAETARERKRAPV